jgi:APA family basic amino acid/polyamine antiporter
LEYAISGSAVARGWASYVHNFFHVVGVELPFWMDNYMPFEKLVGIFSFSPLALVIVIGCSAVLLLGAKKSAWFNKIITLVNLAVIIFVIALGSTKVNKENWNNFFPFGFQGIFQGAGTIFFSYIGFDSVTTLASESANPKRDLPLGIIVTLGVATALYVAVSLGTLQ